MEIWIWQGIITPHMMGLAVALTKTGCKVTYVAENEMREDRRALGWTVGDSGYVRTHVAPSPDAMRDLACSAPTDVVHICSGFRGNGAVGSAVRCLESRGAQLWIVMETVNDAGLKGLLKRCEYRRQVARSRDCISGILAIGYRTPGWLIERGMPAERVYPFTYFLDGAESVGAGFSTSSAHTTDSVRLLFVGQLIRCKGVDLLLRAMAEARSELCTLTVVGGGEEEGRLRALSEQLGLSQRVSWVGVKDMSEIASVMRTADCLVLPSRHDGWGAVASEALIAGTPVICSDSCGCAGVAAASGAGRVFESGSVSGLTRSIEHAIAEGPPSDHARAQTQQWARCLTADVGAQYLLEVIEAHRTGGQAPAPPWARAGAGSDALTIGVSC